MPGIAALEKSLREKEADLDFISTLLKSREGFGDSPLSHGAVGRIAAHFEAEDVSLLYEGAEGTRRKISSSKCAERTPTVSEWPPKAEGSGEISVETLGEDGELFGYLTLRRGDKALSDEERASFRKVAEILAPVVQSWRAQKRAERSRDKAERLSARNERLFKGFFDGSPDMIYTASEEDFLENINEAGIRLLGYRRKEDMIGRPFGDFCLNPSDREKLLCRVRENGSVAEFEMILVQADGNTIYCVESTHALREDKKTRGEIQGIIRNISERIKNEQELWRTNIMLAEANEKLQQSYSLMAQREKLASIGQLAAGVAHEINNPLGYLKSSNETLLRSVDLLRSAWEEVVTKWPEEASAIAGKRRLDFVLGELDNIFKESREGFSRIMRIVQTLKSFSRANSEGLVGDYDLNEGVVNSLNIAWNEIKYVAEVEKSLGDVTIIQANGGEIDQVLLNILINATQAIGGQDRKTRGTIRIETGTNGEYVFVRITDDGPGIPEHLRARVFDPFFTTKEPGKGTGLGLSISYDIVVTKHGGRLAIDTKPGEGAGFLIELPIRGQSSQKSCG